LQELVRRGDRWLLALHDEGRHVVDEWLHEAGYQGLARREVVVERGLGDAELLGDVLEAGLLDPTLGEQLAGNSLDPGLRVGAAGLDHRAPAYSLTVRTVSPCQPYPDELPIGK